MRVRSGILEGNRSLFEEEILNNRRAVTAALPKMDGEKLGEERLEQETYGRISCGT